MERTITQEERIRRAEEIYNRRKKLNGVRVSTNNVNKNEKIKISLAKRMFYQIAICIVIYVIFYLIKNSNYIFSEDVLNKTKEFLSYDINFGNVRNSVSSFIEENKEKFSFLKIFNDDKSDDENNVENTIENNNESANTVGGIGGARDEEEKDNEKDDKKENEEKNKKSQYELDVEYIKNNFKFIVPVKGTVTSRYGKREATEVVSANHQGIDIGANKGTAIYAAMDGTVTTASEEGEYGKHIDITNADVLTRYAHCSKLLVKEGDKVKKGDKIAEVGSTGNSTGPHLHFEIRRDNRTINPESIIDF
jgi:murein DD-endopeptidase MepM/ murein hydrolase activator NlpD